jgi:hypothetical protein
MPRRHSAVRRAASACPAAGASAGGPARSSAGSGMWCGERLLAGSAARGCCGAWVLLRAGGAARRWCGARMPRCAGAVASWCCCWRLVRRAGGASHTDASTARRARRAASAYPVASKPLARAGGFDRRMVLKFQVRVLRRAGAAVGGCCGCSVRRSALHTKARAGPRAQRVCARVVQIGVPARARALGRGGGREKARRPCLRPACLVC